MGVKTPPIRKIAHWSLNGHSYGKPASGPRRQGLQQDTKPNPCPLAARRSAILSAAGYPRKSCPASPANLLRRSRAMGGRVRVGRCAGTGWWHGSGLTSPLPDLLVTVAEYDRRRELEPPLRRFTVQGVLNCFCERRVPSLDGPQVGSGPSSSPSLGDGVMLGTAWIDRPVDTQDLHSLLPRPPQCSMDVQACPSQ